MRSSQRGYNLKIIFGIETRYPPLLLHPAYFPNIITFVALAQRAVVWEAHDNFQKQTYRNRCYICTDQGRHRLTIPIKHGSKKENREKYRDVEIDNTSPWRRLHWRALKTAYNASPFFEFYEDDLKPLFEDDEPYLYAFTMKTLTTLAGCLGLECSDDPQTHTFDRAPSHYFDARFLVDAKKEPPCFLEPYPQVFGEKQGFIANLSILDLLFNEGPNAPAYLKRQSLEVFRSF